MTLGYDDDANVGLNVLGCRADIFRTNCNKLLKLKIKGGEEVGGGGVVASASIRVTMSTFDQSFWWII